MINDPYCSRLLYWIYSYCQFGLGWLKNKNKKYHNKKEKKCAKSQKIFLFCFFVFLLFVFNVLFYLDIESSHKFHQMQSIACNFLRKKWIDIFWIIINEFLLLLFLFIPNTQSKGAPALPRYPDTFAFGFCVWLC